MRMLLVGVLLVAGCGPSMSDSFTRLEEANKRLIDADQRLQAATLQLEDSLKVVTKQRDDFVALVKRDGDLLDRQTAEIVKLRNQIAIQSKIKEDMICGATTGPMPDTHLQPNQMGCEPGPGMECLRLNIKP